MGLVGLRKCSVGDSDDELLQPTKRPALNAVLKNCSAPVMPTVTKEEGHRHKYYSHSPFTHLTALVARPAPNTEMTESPDALAACKKDWTRLGHKPACDITLVREWAGVCATARTAGGEVHLGRGVGFCVEEGAQLPTCHTG